MTNIEWHFTSLESCFARVLATGHFIMSWMNGRQVNLSYDQLSKEIAVQYKRWHLKPLKNHLEECLYFMIFLLFCCYQRAVDRPEFADLSVSQQFQELTSFMVETISQNLQVNLRLNHQSKFT